MDLSVTPRYVPHLPRRPLEPASLPGSYGIWACACVEAHLGQSRKPLLDLLPDTFLRFGTWQRRGILFRRSHGRLLLGVISLLRSRFLRPTLCNLLLGPFPCPDYIVLRYEV